MPKKIAINDLYADVKLGTIIPYEGVDYELRRAVNHKTLVGTRYLYNRRNGRTIYDIPIETLPKELEKKVIDDFLD